MLPLVRELDRRDPLLSRVGWLHVALLAVMLAAMAFDARQVLGINVWIKPSKFAASIAIYVWTLAWFMPYLRGPSWTRQLVRWGVSVAMVVEITCIAGQSLRGSASHFNHATPFDEAVFSVMGLMIVFNTLLEGLVLALFWRPLPALAPAYLWGIRLGLVGSILSAAVGGAMIAHGGHTVGAADGGPGLRLVNWSTQAGDLRIARRRFARLAGIAAGRLCLQPCARSRQQRPRAGGSGYSLLGDLCRDVCRSRTRPTVGRRQDESPG